jgi:hypothetical protein
MPVDISILLVLLVVVDINSQLSKTFSLHDQILQDLHDKKSACFQDQLLLKC